jgi:Holliday junction resolvasome RuvABC DNA-binding subunit
VEDLVSPEYEASREILRRTLTAIGWKKADVKQVLSDIQKDEKIAEFIHDQEE